MGYNTTLQLTESRSVILNSNGEGEINNFGPSTQFEKWKISLMQTVCDSDTETELSVTRRGNTIAGSYSGNFDTNDSPIMLHPGESLSFRYTKGSPDSVATVTLEGERLLRGRLAY